MTEEVFYSLIIYLSLVVMRGLGLEAITLLTETFSQEPGGMENR